MKLPQSIGAIEQIGDLQTRNAMIALRQNIHSAYGISGDPTTRMATLQDLKTLNLANVDAAGIVTPKAATTVTSQDATGAASSAKKTISAKVQMTGWQVGSNYIELSVPQYAVITNGWYYISVAPTSGGAATIQLGIDTDAIAGLLAPTLFSDAIFQVGSHGLIPNNTPATFLSPLTDYRAVVATVAVDTITAGEMTFCLEYFLT